MTIQRMDHVGIVADDIAAATASFIELGLARGPQGIIVELAERVG